MRSRRLHNYPVAPPARPRIPASDTASPEDRDLAQRVGEVMPALLPRRARPGNKDTVTRRRGIGSAPALGLSLKSAKCCASAIVSARPAATPAPRYRESPLDRGATGGGCNRVAGIDHVGASRPITAHRPCEPYVRSSTLEI